MKLRNAGHYSIGLNLDTEAVGWAACDEEGMLLKFKGKPTWGIRHFTEAHKAKDTRLKRGQRRRHERRRQRIQALQGLFLKDMASVDPDFFVRLRQSRLLKEDKDDAIRDDHWPIFNGSDFAEPDYHEKFPTIYHLRKHLMESEVPEDLRLVYLALHHIVKYRGNFLYEDQGGTLSASNADATAAAEELAQAFSDYLDDCVDTDSSLNPNLEKMARALGAPGLSNKKRVEELAQALSPSGKDIAPRCKAVARACTGAKVNFATVFEGIEGEERSCASFALSKEEDVQEFLDKGCPDDAMGLFEAIQKAYSAYTLSGILKGSTCLSDAMIAAYDRHKADLKTIKALFREYLSKDDFREFFRGAKDGKGYDINGLVKGTYTSYVRCEKGSFKKDKVEIGTTHEDLIKRIKELCESAPALMEDERYKGRRDGNGDLVLDEDGDPVEPGIADRLDAGPECDFLLKQRTRANGSIPYQLHLEEMDAIIEKQGKFYPFLAENREFIESLVSSRIAYYVGPLYAGPDPLAPYASNPVDPTRRFAWSVRKPGMERAKAYPWNYEEIIDCERTADLFIRRMTGTCTYLLGEPVLPRHSLLYEEYCVLNELNGVKWCVKGGKPRRFDHVDKERIFKELFKNRASANVSADTLKRWLREEHGVQDVEVMGFQGDKDGFASKLSTYHDFCKIFGVKDLALAPLPESDIETIVHWNTVFEDRQILKAKLAETYGPDGNGKLTQEQIKRIVARRYVGWGKFSKKLLTGIKVPASVPSGFVSIMDILICGDPNDRLRQKVLMEIVTDKDLGFADAIETENDAFLSENDGYLRIANMPGSPSARRSATQAMRIVAEIAAIAGKAPSRICIEVNREGGRKGGLAKTRHKSLKDALTSFKNDEGLLDELEERKADLDDDRLLLYFQQQGRCAYSAERIDIAQLNSSLYQIDYIVPKAYIDDGSIDNRVLVKSNLNQRKHDSLLLDDSIVDARAAWWKTLRDNGLISDSKYSRLTCRSVSDRQLTAYLCRQLTETDRTIAYVRRMCEHEYPSTEIVLVRAATVNGIRANLELPRLKRLNACHHAHDAFLGCQIAEFIDRCYPRWKEGFNIALVRKRLQSIAEKTGYRMPGRSGFIADSMAFRRHVDQATGEILWDIDARNAYIKDVLRYKTYFTSRMTEIATGQFWPETIYSPKDNRNGPGLHTPLKSTARERNHEGYLDPQKYGGPTRPQNAYWFIFAAKDWKGKTKLFLEGMPIPLAQNGKVGLQEHAESLAKEKGYKEAVVLRRCIPLRQKLVIDGVPYCFYGSGEIRPAQELMVDWDLAEKLYLRQEDLTTADMAELYRQLSSAGAKIHPESARKCDLAGKAQAFEKLSREDKIEQLRIIARMFNGESQTVDLSLLGGAKHGGRVMISPADLSSIEWADESVTGMFEKRTPMDNPFKTS